MLEHLKKAWGVGAPRGFKAGAWITAIVAFGAWQYYDRNRLAAGVGGPLSLPNDQKK